jgi:hypothetical protein
MALTYIRLLVVGTDHCPWSCTPFSCCVTENEQFYTASEVMTTETSLDTKTLTENVTGFPQSLHINVGIVSRKD